MRRVGYALVAFMLVAASCVGGPRAYAAPAASLDSVLLLMDLSGSMADRDSARNIKIEGAKTGVISLLESLPSSARVGLMTFPGSGGCTAPKQARDIRPLAQENLGAQVSGLPAPSGQTPTALALRTAAETSRQSGGNATIVLVSDGLANCGEPPCPVAQEIAASGVPITVNTVGFDIDTKGATELQCIADATGGSYVDVSDGAELGVRIAEQMSPQLEIWSNFPSGPVPVSSTGAVVRARISNTSGVTASNVRVALTPQGGDAYLGILRPVLFLGNIAGGDSREVSWTIPVATALSGQQVQLRITASSGNAALAQADGVVRFGDGPLVGPDSAFAGFQRVAVLGDSFSAGDGAHSRREDYAPTAWPHDCRQSKEMYAEQLFPGKVDNYACTGAEADDVRSRWQAGSVKPQLEQLSDALRNGTRYDAVFLTIGGNDVLFGDIATNCITHQILSPASLGAGLILNPCAVDPSSILYPHQQTLVNGIGTSLELTYEELATTFAGHGVNVPPIIVSPYPLMFPSDPGLRFTCGLINLGVSQARLQQFLDFQRQLNRVVEESVIRTRDQSGIPVYFASGAEFAMQPGHTMCGSASWINLPRLDNSITWARSAHDLPFHPNADGHGAWALALARWAERPELELQKGTKPPGQRLLPSVFQLAPRGAVNGDASWNVVPAGEAEISVMGLAPGTPVIASVRSHPVGVGHAIADETGNATLSVRIDNRLIPPGPHTLQVALTESGGRETVRESWLYVTRPMPYAYGVGLVLGVVLLVTGLVTRVISRSRKTPTTGSSA